MVLIEDRFDIVTRGQHPQYMLDSQPPKICGLTVMRSSN
jgi:hypothetical protein